MKKWFITWLMMSWGLLLAACSQPAADNNHIKVGAILEMTGSIPAVGASSKNGIEMAVKEVNDQGGLDVLGKKMPVKLIIEDNGGQADQSAQAAQKLIHQDNVIAILGPNASLGAIPAADIAEAAKTPLITPWSTNPKATLDSKTQAPKKYVFRACFTDPFESKILAAFAHNYLKANTAAVLYDMSSEAPTSQATTFQQEFEKLGGKIVAFETYSNGDKDFSAQLTKIKAANPQVLFLPAYYNDVPLIAQQAKSLGLKTQLLGSDAWSSPDLIKLANGAVEGAYFANHYAADAKVPATQKFVADYEKTYGKPPDDIAALSYDAAKILFRAISVAGTPDHHGVRDSLAHLQPFQGVTGQIQFHGQDPVKSAVIMQVKGNRFVWVANENP